MPFSGEKYKKVYTSDTGRKYVKTFKGKRYLKYPGEKVKTKAYRNYLARNKKSVRKVVKRRKSTRKYGVIRIPKSAPKSAYPTLIRAAAKAYGKKKGRSIVVSKTNAGISYDLKRRSKKRGMTRGKGTVRTGRRDGFKVKRGRRTIGYV